MSSLVDGANAGGGAGGPSGSGGAGGPSSSDGEGEGAGPCGACKFLWRKCVSRCIFMPYFDSEQGAAHFASVHKVFGASNSSKLLNQILPHKRLEAVVTICFEAQARLREPVYGCVSQILALQQQVSNLQAELSYVQSHLATIELPSPPPFTAQAQMPMTGASVMSDLSSFPNIQATVDLSSFFDPQTRATDTAEPGASPRAVFSGRERAAKITPVEPGGGPGPGVAPADSLW